MDPDFTDEKDGRDNVSSISSDLIRGHINTIILRTLYDGDKYGYEIINEIEEKSKKQYTLKQPTLYSALKRLEGQDYVTSYWGGAENGGRRKYFQITDKGRQVVEQNLAEWEYSRTVIDSLISEKDYDFDNPPPAQTVDFNILKKSTTRVSIPGGEEEEEEFSYGGSPAPRGAADGEQAEEGETTVAAAEAEAHAEETEETAEARGDEVTQAPAAEASAAETAEAQPAQDEAPAAQDERPAHSFAQPAQAYGREEAVYAEQADEETARAHAELTEAEQRRIHENYKNLVGDEDATAYYYSSVARSNAEAARAQEAAERERLAAEQAEREAQEAAERARLAAEQAERERLAAEQAAREQAAYAQAQQEYAYGYGQNGDYGAQEPLYADLPPAERNYKELISRLYENAQPAEADAQAPAEAPAAEESAPAQEQPAQPARVRPAGNVEFSDLQEQAEDDGLKITTSDGTRGRTAVRAVGSTFDKGKVLFLTAVYVFIVALAESILNICLMGVLGSGAAYVTLPFVLTFVFLGIFLFLYLRGYGKNSRRSQAKSYVSASLILYANLVLIICLIAFLVIYLGDESVRFVHVLRYAIFPSIFAFNVPLFAILYNYNCKKE